MSNQDGGPPIEEAIVSDLDLNKETLSDLDVEPADAGQVKGGQSGLRVSGVVAQDSTIHSGGQFMGGGTKVSSAIMPSA